LFNTFDVKAIQIVIELNIQATPPCFQGYYGIFGVAIR
jgi:hypothetical protein